MGDFVYSFSSGGATVHRTADLQLFVELDLPGYKQNDYYFSEESSLESGEETEAESSEEESNM